MKPIMLWSVPRSLSTVFERAIMTRGEIRVFHEPYTEAYYFGPERVSTRYAEQPPDPDKSYAATTDRLFGAAAAGQVFVKDMAYAAAGKLDEETFDRFHHTFLVRDPRRAIPSLYRLSVDTAQTGWDHFDPVEAGFTQALELYRRAKRNNPDSVEVIDAQKLLDDPASVLRRYCAKTGLIYGDDMLSWSAEKPPTWGTWAPWHKRAMSSTGFEQRPPSTPPDLDALPPEVAQAVESSLPAYRELTSGL